MARTKLSQETKTVQCYSCGCPLEVNGYVRTPKRCLRCGIEASVQAMREMQARSGPTYERWRGGMLAHAARLARTTPPPT